MIKDSGPDYSWLFVVLWILILALTLILGWPYGLIPLVGGGLVLAIGLLQGR